MHKPALATLLQASFSRCRAAAASSLGSQLGGGIEDGTDDLVVAGAPAQVASEPVARLSLGRICKRDEERLVHLRAAQARDELIRFERDLGCERLRPQFLRLGESIFAEGER